MHILATAAAVPEAVAAAVEPGSVHQAAMSHADIIPKVRATLPTETRCPPYLLRQYAGFWCTDAQLNGIAGDYARFFKPRPTDIFLASIPKSGTTWLKALAFATLNRGTHPPLASDHPLRTSNPHDCVRFLEIECTLAAAAAEDAITQDDVLAELPSPRLLATHVPYSLLPRCITGGEDNGCRFVYVCRDPKDVLVSFGKYNEKTAATLKKVAGVEAPSPPALEQVFELFCEGRTIFGPQWRHALEFWEESKRRPGKVLFLRYEEMLRDPVGNVRKLASFMGCPFSAEEEDAGVVGQIVDLCSFGSLKNSEVNKSGSTILGIKNDTFFRKGGAGDWKNHLTPEMAARLDQIVEEALRGSGLTLTSTI